MASTRASTNTHTEIHTRDVSVTSEREALHTALSVQNAKHLCLHTRRQTEEQRRVKTSIHYTASPATPELLLRPPIAVNQLSICGAEAKWCNKKSLPETVSKPGHEQTLYRQNWYVSSHSTKLWISNAYHGKPIPDTDRKIQRISTNLKLTQVCRDARFTKLVEILRDQVDNVAGRDGCYKFMWRTHSLSWRTQILPRR